MNCKQGDLAMLVRSEAGNEGLVMTCVELMPAGYAQTDPQDGPQWRVDRMLLTNLGVWKNYAPDSWLMPITPPRSEVVEHTEELVTQ